MVQTLRTTLIPLDTLQCAKRLQEVGFTEKQAEEQITSSKKLTKQQISSTGHKTIVALRSLTIAGITILSYLK